MKKQAKVCLAVGDKVRIRALPFIVEALHGMTGTVSKTKQFTCQSSGIEYVSVWIQLERACSVPMLTWPLNEVIFSVDCCEVIGWN